MVRESALCSHHGVNRTAQHEDRTGGTRTALEDLHHGQGHRSGAGTHAGPSQLLLEYTPRGPVASNSPKIQAASEGEGQSGTPRKTTGSQDAAAPGGRPAGVWPAQTLTPRKATDAREQRLRTQRHGNQRRHWAELDPKDKEDHRKPGNSGTQCKSHQGRGRCEC